MCGIVASIQSDQEAGTAAVEIHDALYILQHRGQDACGIMSCDNKGRIQQCKGNGMASKVFDDGRRVIDLPGFMALGHLRYPTSGSRRANNAEAQPFYVNAPYGLGFSHNGNLINAEELKGYLDKVAHRHINTDSDSELMLNIFASELNETNKARVNPQDCFAALERTYKRCIGGWACVAMIAGYGIMGFRDSYGIRPLVLGWKQSSSGTGVDYMLASESVALTGCGYFNYKDIKPGEAVIIRKGTAKEPMPEPIYYQVEQPKAYAPDIFEFIYFSRGSSTVDGISVYQSRQEMGYNLAERIRSQLSPEELESIDVVIPIPETSSISAYAVSRKLKKPYVQAFEKNRYIFRTFIMPNQHQRQKGVRAKLIAIPQEFQGRNVLLVDDSIVRGTTSREIVSMAREAGAEKVYFASCAPPITHAHIYGIDLATSSELIAYHRSSDEIAKHICADGVIYQTLDDLVAACAKLSPRKETEQKFEVGVFCGKYVTPVEDGYFEHLEQVRGESKVMKTVEEARAALMQGVAGEEQIRMVSNGVVVDEAGNIVPAPDSNSQSRRSSATDGYGNGFTDNSGQKQRVDSDGQVRVCQNQDISLHNLNDYGRS
ncbi:MAG: amidophosphoribosyltransferase [Bogoriella megaspora]|nr:MAG: amidophosphoribosyltransferase [Bogoriella megaspora]